MPASNLILASSSPFRRELLDRLGLPFESISPEVDESILKGEIPTDYVQRLAQAKAQAIAEQHPQALVIGSDQCAYLDGEILGKPGSHSTAVNQLRNASAREVVFYTGLTLTRVSSNFLRTSCIKYRVGFRTLNDQEIERYLHQEQPYNCAGSFKSEGLGITLFSYMRGDDPTALIGLPLIELADMLREAGMPLP